MYLVIDIEKILYSHEPFNSKGSESKRLCYFDIRSEVIVDQRCLNILGVTVLLSLVS